MRFLFFAIALGIAWVGAVMLSLGSELEPVAPQMFIFCVSAGASLAFFCGFIGGLVMAKGLSVDDKPAAWNEWKD